MSTPRRNAAKIQSLRQQGRPQSASGGGHRSVVPNCGFLRRPGLAAGQVRDAPPRRGRQNTRHRSGSRVRPITPCFLSSPACRCATGPGRVSISRKRGPHGAHKLTPAGLDFVLQQRAASPSITIAELITSIQHRFGVAVHRRTIERHLAGQEKKLR